MNRFLLLLVLSSCASTEPILPPAPREPLGFSILQGPTSAHETEITVLRPSLEQPTYQVLDEQKNLVPSSVKSKVIPETVDSWTMDHLKIRGLRPHTPFVLEVRTSQGLIDQRIFRTLDTSNPVLRIAIASCLDDSFYREQVQMWGELKTHRPDMLFLIGDNVYVDRGLLRNQIPDPLTFWKRYRDTRNALALYRWRELVPTYAVWDDHDYGVDGGDRSFPEKKIANEVFRTFFPQTLPQWISGPGASGRLAFGPHRFYFMDSRSFRSEPYTKKSETHWGHAQETWFFKHASENKPFWLIEGDPFFGRYHTFDSYERHHPVSFDRVAARLKALRAPFFLVSGDRHWIELQEVGPEWFGFPAYELTTSGIHAHVFLDDWKLFPNPRQVFGFSNTHNYALVESRVLPRNALALQIQGFGPELRKLFEKTIVLRKTGGG